MSPQKSANGTQTLSNSRQADSLGQNWKESQNLSNSGLRVISRAILQKKGRETDQASGLNPKQPKKRGSQHNSHGFAFWTQCHSKFSGEVFPKHSGALRRKSQISEKTGYHPKRDFIPVGTGDQVDQTKSQGNRK
jgi:hypothetical protein